MDNYIVCTIKSWNIKNFEKIKKKYKNINWFLITDKKKLTIKKLKEINPKFIFFPHWSWIIPAEIFENFNCVVFHMTDLPFGRGGSPLQNLIVREIYQTKISAIKVVQELDAGDVYCKEPLDLSEGSADYIFSKASEIVFNKMIPYIINNNPIPQKQKGEVISFNRRKPEQSNINKLKKMNDIYNYIRMLDGEGYPKAFIETEKFIIKFSDAQIFEDKINAKCEITIKGEKNE